LGSKAVWKGLGHVAAALLRYCGCHVAHMQVWQCHDAMLSFVCAVVYWTAEYMIRIKEDWCSLWWNLELLNSQLGDKLTNTKHDLPRQEKERYEEKRRYKEARALVERME
jgi:hypothetical protein